MNILSVENLSKSLGLRSLFTDLTFGIAKGEKVALVAKNGTGKTTLLNIISSVDSKDGGMVSVRKGIRIAFLPQEPKIQENITLSEVVFSAENPVIKIVRDYEESLVNPEKFDALQSAMDAMDAHQAWDFEAKMKQILSELGLDDLSKNTSSLSGGQRKRLALALTLIQEPDFLILDEPTNHLDLHMIEWLEKYLQTGELTILMVTHDRYFLDRVCTAIFELIDGKIYRYNGNYGYFIEKKIEREEAEKSSIEKAKNLYKKELEWMRRQPQARATKAKARIDAFYDVEAKAKQKIKEQDVKMEISMSRMGGKIIEVKHLKKSFGEKRIIGNFSYVFKKKDKIGIIGLNGVGKSTFLKLLTNDMPVDAGEISVGETIVFGFYKQEGIQLPADKRVIEVIKDIAEFLPIGKNKVLTASQLLERFLFSGDQQYTFVSKLSGGEKRRLYLCTLLIKNPNFLILDEPTNDLDIQTLTVLEDFLEEFEGCLLIVTHDRYFMDKLVEHLFIFEGDGNIRDYNGNYSEYQDEMAEKGLALFAAIPSQAKTPAPAVSATGAGKKIVPHTPDPAEPPINKASFKEKQEFEKLETEIKVLERRKRDIMQIFETNIHTSPLQIKDLSLELEEIERLLDKKEFTWIQLGEKM